MSGCLNHTFSAFVQDCSPNSPNAQTPECDHLYHLFLEKDIVSSNVECGPVRNEPDPRIDAPLPAQREEYIHDTRTGLWYHCCEHRPLYGKFSVEVPQPRLLETSGGSLQRHAGKAIARGVSNIMDAFDNLKSGHQTSKALLQCNVMENMRHSKDSAVGSDDGAGWLRPSAPRTLPGSYSQPCEGDDAVPLRKLTSDATVRLREGICIDAGPHGAATPQGKPYHVFSLAVPWSMNMVPSFVDRHNTRHTTFCNMCFLWPETCQTH